MSVTATADVAPRDETAHPNHEVIQGLRELADFLECAPTVPRLHAQASVHVADRDEWIGAFLALAGEIDADGSYASVRRRFGPVELRIQTDTRGLIDNTPPEDFTARVRRAIRELVAA